MGKCGKRPPGGDYEVGYGRPPKHTQFKKGQSGNPKGRPKKEGRAITLRQVRADILSAMEREVTITRDGKQETVTIFQAGMDQLMVKAAKGDMRALRLVIALRRDCVSEHEEAQVRLAEELLGAERWLKEAPETVSLEDRELIREIQRRVYNPFTLD
jgi:Family of unknown function (DUF5681)